MWEGLHYVGLHPWEGLRHIWIPMVVDVRVWKSRERRDVKLVEGKGLRVSGVVVVQEENRFHDS